MLHPDPRRSRPAWLAVGASGVLVVAAFLPWAASGQAQRNSFELFRVAEHLDVLPSGSLATVARAWPLLPLLAAVGLGAAALGWTRLAGVVAVALGAASIVAAVVVLRSPLPACPGVGLALVAGVAAVVTGTWATVRSRPEAPLRGVGPLPTAPPVPR